MYNTMQCQKPFYVSVITANRGHELSPTESETSDEHLHEEFVNSRYLVTTIELKFLGKWGEDCVWGISYRYLI